MGVVLFMLDRRSVTLIIGETRHTVGTLRRHFKLTELDERGSAEVVSAATAMPSPLAAMLMDISEMPMRNVSGKYAAAHLVLGWDNGRESVTDLGWDYLPRLGYAVRDPHAHEFILHEEGPDGYLVPINTGRAGALGLLDASGSLVQRGQPRIRECRRVRHYLSGYAEAECVFENGAIERLLTRIADNDMPPTEWFVGKRPMDVARF